MRDSVRTVCTILCSAPRITVLLGVPLVALTVFNLARDYHLSAVEIGMASISAISALVFLKSALGVSFYTLFYRRRFVGSRFLVSAIVSVFFVNSLVLAVWIARSKAPSFPTDILPVAIPVVYVVITLLLWLGFSSAQRVHEREDTLS